MNILIFEWKNFGTSDVGEALTNLGHSYKIVENEYIHDRVCPEFDEVFETEFSTGLSGTPYDCVFTFNFCPNVSNNCNKRNVPYIAFTYDSPLVALYSYTVINPCNYIFIFDMTTYLELKNEGINTVYYAPLAVNTSRLERQIKQNDGKYTCDVAFIGSMYNEKHNLFDRLKDLPEYVTGYLKGIMESQLKVQGYYFIQELLRDDIVKELQKSVPLQPNKYGVETVEYLYAHYFIARKLANMERVDLLGEVSKHFHTNLYTPNPTPELPDIHNMGPIDYYDQMPYIFDQSKINLNISLRSIRSGIPLRCMDIMGAGGFLLSNYQADFYNHFTPEEDLVLYESKEDLIQKCDYYLKHDSERAQIAANGHGIVKEKHTYEVRLKEIFDIVFN